MNHNVHLVSLGCPKNRVDSEVMLGNLLKGGYTLTGNPAQAGLIVVNTCGFIRSAKEESIQTILELARYKKTGGCHTLVVTGCLIQRYGQSLADLLDEADLFVGLGEFQKLTSFLKTRTGRSTKTRPPNLAKPVFLYSHATARRLSTPFYMAYLKIAEGCDNHCAFCVIPGFRGKQRSRTISDIVREAQKLARQGVREINLIAQDLTAYGVDLHPRAHLATLLKELDSIEGLDWIRPLYCYPRSFSPELLDVLAHGKRITRYLDLPLQHISDPVLKLMQRGRNRASIEKILESLRTAVPDMVLRTSFIVGFPGETKADFKELCAFVRHAQFDHVGVFMYSDEEGSAAEKLSDKLAPPELQERHDALMELQRAIALKRNRRRVGLTRRVLVEGPHPESDDLLAGRWEGMAPEIDGSVIINEGTAPPGSLVDVLFTAAGPYDLVGKIVTR